MISLTRREFDAVSTALLEALADAKRGAPAAERGFRPRRAARDPAGSPTRRRAVRLVAPVH